MALWLDPLDLGRFTEAVANLAAAAAAEGLLSPPPSPARSPGAAGAAPAVAEESARAANPDASAASPLAVAVGPAEEGILEGATLSVWTMFRSRKVVWLEEDRNLIA